MRVAAGWLDSAACVSFPPTGNKEVVEKIPSLLDSPSDKDEVGTLVVEVEENSDGILRLVC